MEGKVDRGIVHDSSLSQALECVILGITNSKLHQKVGNDSIEMTLVVKALFKQFDSSIVSIWRPTLTRRIYYISKHNTAQHTKKKAGEERCSSKTPTHSLASDCRL